MDVVPVNCEEDLLKARWKKILADPSCKDVDFIVSLTFHRWERFVKLLPRGPSTGGRRHFTLQDIHRFNREHKSFGARCHAALVQWIEASDENGHKQLFQALRDGGLSCAAEKIQKEFATPCDKPEANAEYTAMKSFPLQAVDESAFSASNVPMLQHVPNTVLQLLPRSLTSRGAKLGCAVTIASWNSALVAVQHCEDKPCTTPGKRKAALESIRKEYQALSLLRHPNVLSIYGVHVPDTGCAGLVTEVFETTLYSRCRAYPKLLYCDVLPILSGIASALCCLHASRLVHTNLTSKVVFLTWMPGTSQRLTKIGGAVKHVARRRRSSLPENKLRGPVSLHRSFSVTPAEPPAPEYQAISALLKEEANDIARFGRMAVEAILGTEPRGDAPKQWVMTLSRQGCDNRFTRLVSKCLEKSEECCPTAVEVQQRLKEMNSVHVYDSGIACKIPISSFDSEVCALSPPSNDVFASRQLPPSELQPPGFEAMKEEVLNLKHELRRMEGELDALRGYPGRIQNETEKLKILDEDPPTISLTVPTDDVKRLPPEDDLGYETPYSRTPEQSPATSEVEEAKRKSPMPAHAMPKSKPKVLQFATSSKQQPATSSETTQEIVANTQRRKSWEFQRVSSAPLMQRGRTSAPVTPHRVSPIGLSSSELSGNSRRATASAHNLAVPLKSRSRTGSPCSSGRKPDYLRRVSAPAHPYSTAGPPPHECITSGLYEPLDGSETAQISPPLLSDSRLSNETNDSIFESSPYATTPVKTFSFGIVGAIRQSFNRKKPSSGGKSDKGLSEEDFSPPRQQQSDQERKGFHVWRSVKNSLGAPSFRRRGSALMQPTPAVGAHGRQQDLRRRHSESDATVHTVPQGDLQDAPRIKVAGSLDALQQRQHRRSPVAEEKPKPHIARDCPGVKCIALRSHEPHSADELSLSCGGPLIVWKDSSGSDSDEECKARARCLLTGVVGSVPADSFISLKRVKRRLFAYSFHDLGESERMSVQRQLEECLPEGSLPLLCNALLKDAYPTGGYEVILERCREKNTNEFDEMFQLWCNTSSAQGLAYFEAAAGLGGYYEYQSRVLEILKVLREEP